MSVGNRPNILFILSDQQRWDTLGCYGQTLPVSPNLDRLALDGVRFENTFTCQPVCGPARSCLQTGLYATESGCFCNGIPLPVDQDTIAKQLSREGYETAYVGKWHLASRSVVTTSHEVDTGELSFQDRPIPPERRGGYLDYWIASDLLEFTSHGYGGHLFDGSMRTVEFYGYRVDAVTSFAIDYLNNRRTDRPFFLFLSFLEPHHQNDVGHYQGPRGAWERFRDFTPPGDLVGREGDWAEEFPDYLGCCNSIDHNVGRIEEALIRLGLKENTLLIYTSDHGSHFRTRNRNIEEYNFDDYKRSGHDASIRVPLIVNGPGFAQGVTVEHLVSLIDLPVTILTAAGIGGPPWMRGNPVQRLLDGDTEGWPEEVFVQISESQVARAVRTQEWAYSVRALGANGSQLPGASVYHEDFLYNLRQDPYERVNLVRDPGLAEKRGELATTLKRRMREAGEPSADILPAP